MQCFSKIVASAFVFLSANAFAQPLTVACYSDNASSDNFTVYLDQANKQVTFASTIGGVAASFESQPSAWGWDRSQVSLASGDFRAQIIGGDAEQPMIASSVRLQMAPEAQGKMRLVSAEIYQGDTAYDVRSVVGASCYVQ